MEFLGIGYQELLLVFVLLLVVVGPERLPAMAYQIGRAVRTMQRYARAVRDEFREEIDYVEEQVRVVRGELDTARVAIKEQEQEFRAEMRALDEATKVDLPPLLGPSDAPAASANPAPAAPEPSANGHTAGSEATSASPGKKPLVF